MENNTPEHTGKRFKQDAPCTTQVKAHSRFKQGAVNNNNNNKVKPSTVSMLSSDKKSKKKNGLAKDIGLGVLFLILALIVVAFAYIHHINSQMAIKDEREAQELQEVLDKQKANNEFYIMLIGSDARGDNTSGSRSDVNMLCHVSLNNGVVELVSIPRDTAVNLPGHGKQKINAAYAFDGPSGIVQAMNEFAGVPIRHYVEVRFQDVVTVVDMLGGVEVNLPQGLHELGVNLQPGVHTLNGKQALSFARARYTMKGGDFARAQAQRIIVQAIIDKVMSAPINEMPGMISNIAGCVQTDMNVNDLVDMATKLHDKGFKMYSAVCPSYTFNENGISYVGTMYDEWKIMMQRVDASMDPNSTEGTIPEKQKNNDKLGQANNGAGSRDYHDRAQNAMTTDDVVPE